MHDTCKVIYTYATACKEYACTVPKMYQMHHPIGHASLVYAPHAQCTPTQINPVRARQHPTASFATREFKKKIKKIVPVRTRPPAGARTSCGAITSSRSPCRDLSLSRVMARSVDFYVPYRRKGCAKICRRRAGQCTLHVRHASPGNIHLSIAHLRLQCE